MLIGRNSEALERPRSAVESSVHNLCDEITALEVAANGVELKISKSLRPSPPRDAGSEPKIAPAPCKSQLVYEIDEQASRIRNLREKLQALFEHCEL